MAQPVDLSLLSASEFKKFLDSFDHVFSDCDGVIWSPDPLPGADKFFKKIKEHGKTVHFVSNNSIKTKERYNEQFASVCIENGYDFLTIPSIAMAEYLKSKDFKKKIYCVACPQTVKVLESYGYECVIGPDSGSDRYQDYIEYLTDDPQIGAVVFDSDFKVNLPRILKAITYLKRGDVLFISGASDKYVPIKQGQLCLSTGVFTDIVSAEAKRLPVQLGKPGKAFGEFAMKKAGVTDPSRVLFIGDMIDQDVGLGRATGFTTLLLLTSLNKEKMMEHPLKPHFYANSLDSIVPML